MVLKILSPMYMKFADQDVTTEVADRIKDIGFEYAMKSGATIAVADITIPPKRKQKSSTDAQ